MSKFSFKSLVVSLVLSALVLLILNLMVFAIFQVRTLLEAFDNATGGNGNEKVYTFNLTRNLIALVVMTIIMYMGVRDE